MDHKINEDFLRCLGMFYNHTQRFALVKFGGGIVQMSGSMSGNTFARNRSGNYVRARTTPVNPNTARQVITRAILGSLTGRWSQVLTAVQRTAWNLYASSVVMNNRLGEAINLTGFNHFLRSNSWRLDLGQTPVDNGPTQFDLPAQDGTISVAASAATQLVTVTFDDGHAWCSEDDAGIMILEGSPQNPQRNFFAGPYRGRSAKMGSVAVPITSPQDYAAIHVLTEGQRIWVKFRVIRADGRISEPFTANTFCAA